MLRHRVYAKKYNLYRNTHHFSISAHTTFVHKKTTHSSSHILIFEVYASDKTCVNKNVYIGILCVSLRIENLFVNLSRTEAFDPSFCRRGPSLNIGYCDPFQLTDFPPDAFDISTNTSSFTRDFKSWSRLFCAFEGAFQKGRRRGLNLL